MSSDPKPKIIVDDDWKTRVQAEKESLRESQDTKTDQPSPGTKNESTYPPLPPPSFPLLVSTLATEALAALGQIPRADNQAPEINLDLAKHFIDTLGMLEEKTKGNLSLEESRMLENVLHELRMAFVALNSRAEGAKSQ